MSTFRLGLVSAAAGTLYLALAVWGEGGLSAFVAHPSLVALALITVALTAAAQFSSGNLSPAEREDRGNRWVLLAFGVIGLLSAWLPAYTDRKEFWASMARLCDGWA
ncbi:MAG: hypothetical protein AB7F22_18080 [Reyranella sp.]|uniref:hypothetical protein n=1 Tax=Reyranella sp. TaxID=1929291 RepID=UPI003D1218A4